jgi:phospholipase C
MTDLRDAEAAEALEQTAPDEYLRRREFLQRTAMTAGLGAGLSTVLSSDTLVAEAARRQRRTALPAPKNLPIDTIVVLMMENRSFDHYLGWLPGADGRQAGLSYKDAAGKDHATHRLTPDFQGCGFKDPDHSWDGGRAQLAGGKCDGWLKEGSDNDDFALGYYQEGDLGFIQDAAKAFTTFDRFFCSLMGSTLPNREYMHAGESYGLRDNDLPPQTEHRTGFPDNTIFAALAAAGVSNRYFYVDVPVSALWGQEGLARSGPVSEYYERCATGTLPQVSFVDPYFAGSAGEGPGASGDEHPHGDVRMGQAFMADVVHAFMESPQYKNGLLFITYDEWGGFFDHVRPPRVPDQRNSRKLSEDYGQMGFRLPTIAVSPYARRGHVAHSVYGFESILKLISYRFGLKPLNKRVAYARNIGRSLDFASKPRLDPRTCRVPSTSSPSPARPAARARTARPSTISCSSSPRATWTGSGSTSAARSPRTGSASPTRSSATSWPRRADARPRARAGPARGGRRRRDGSHAPRHRTRRSPGRHGQGRPHRRPRRQRPALRARRQRRGDRRRRQRPRRGLGRGRRPARRCGPRCPDRRPGQRHGRGWGRSRPRQRRRR